MAVFCDQSGVRLIAPNGIMSEAADAKAYREKTGKLRPVSVKVDPENGWQEAPPLVAAKPVADEPKAAPEAERNAKPAAPAANESPRRGNK
jgi:hypothetical protein